MRFIEEQMVEAISRMKNWSKDNTEVVVTDESIKVYLFNNLIATIGKGKVILSNCGWYTKTTKSRLNVIMLRSSTKISGSNKHEEWFVIEDNYRKGIPFYDANRITKKPFYNGIELDFIMY